MSYMMVRRPSFSHSACLDGRDYSPGPDALTYSESPYIAAAR